MQARDFLAGLLGLGHQLLSRLMLGIGLVCQVAECSVAVHSGRASNRLLLGHESPNLLLHPIVLLTQFIVFFFDAKVMLNFLCLITVSCVHLLRSYTLQLFFKSLLFVCKSFQSQHELFNVSLALLKHFFLLPHIVIESLTLTSALRFVASRVFDLAILDLDQLAQVLILFLQSFVL